MFYSRKVKNTTPSTAWRTISINTRSVLIRGLTSNMRNIVDININRDPFEWYSHKTTGLTTNKKKIEGRDYPAAPHLCHAVRRQLRNPEKPRTERLHAWLSCQPLDSRFSWRKEGTALWQSNRASPYSACITILSWWSIIQKLKKSHACMHASHASDPGAVPIWF